MKGYKKIRNFRLISPFISETIQDWAILWNATRNSYATYQMVLFPMTYVTSNPDFKVTPLVEAEYHTNGTIYRQLQRSTNT